MIAISGGTVDDMIIARETEDGDDRHGGRTSHVRLVSGLNWPRCRQVFPRALHGVTTSPNASAGGSLGSATAGAFNQRS